MENTPHLIKEEDSPKQESGREHKKEAGAIGSLVINPAAEHQPYARKNREVAPGASQLHGQTSPRERIGQVLISAEASPTIENNPETKPQRHVETMSRSELLELSKSINIDGTSLHQVYETHLIGEQGLRRLIAEHFQGGDLKKALRREVIERETDFERDPALRDRARQSMNKGGAAALNHLLRQVTADDTSENQEEAAFYKARANYEADQQQIYRSQRRIVDFSLAGIIAALTALVIILYLTRR